MQTERCPQSPEHHLCLGDVSLLTPLSASATDLSSLSIPRTIAHCLPFLLHQGQLMVSLPEMPMSCGLQAASVLKQGAQKGQITCLKWRGRREMLIFTSRKQFLSKKVNIVYKIWKPMSYISISEVKKRLSVVTQLLLKIKIKPFPLSTSP